MRDVHIVGGEPVVEAIVVAKAVPLLPVLDVAWNR